MRQQAEFPAGPAVSTPDERRSSGSTAQAFGGTPAAMPTVLLTATLRWPIAARLAMAFADLGCRVDVLCPPGHPVALTAAVTRVHGHSPLGPLVSLRAAIESSAPAIVLPCDDDAAVQLHRLHGHAGPGALQALIARSLGSPQACELATMRARLLAVAAESGVLVPQTTAVANADELRAWLASHRLPAVLKLDGTWGGRGVAVVRNHDEARRLFDRMATRPPLLHALARTLLDRDGSLVADALRSERPAITLQSFIAGRPANRAVACWQGRVLAGTSVEALETQHPTGPATVVRVIDHPQMAQAALRVVHRLGLSGLWGFDFVIEAATGAAYLIEMNPRATPICHLALGAGHDLPAALLGPLGAAARPASTPPIDGPVIALFPGEWHRDPASPYLRSAHHDVPWREPALVRDGIAPPWAERGIVAQAWRRLRPTRLPRVPGTEREPVVARGAADGAAPLMTLDKAK